MDETFICNRITQLRIAAGKSEREMSLDLGHSASYIHSIATGRACPSMREFLYICEYLNITPEEFFRVERTVSPIKRRAIAQLLELDDHSVSLLSQFIDSLKGQ